MIPHRALASLLLASCLAAAPARAAAPRALFDNAHAETSGNSDWVIDTDQPVPLPDQGTVGPATPRTYWLGGISSWGIDLVKRGYQVATNLTPITYGNTSNPYDLSFWDVFILPEPNTLFTAAESTAIFNYVRDGGGVVFVVDHYNSDRNGDGWDSPRIYNAFDAQKLWGVHWQVNGEANNSITQDSGNVETSPADSVISGPNGVADSLSFHAGDTAVLDPGSNPRVRGLVWMNGLAHGNTGVMAARSEYGSGRIVTAGDSSPIDDGSAAPGNSSIFDGWGEASGRDSLFFMNATFWATRRSAPAVDVTPRESRLADGVALSRATPNPSASRTSFSFTLPAAANVTLEVLDAGGRRVRTLAAGEFAPGTHAAAWDGRDARGREAGAGLYFARLVTPWGSRTVRAVRVR